MDRSSIQTIPYSKAEPSRTAATSHHSRSLSHPALFNPDSLPPLCPHPYSKTSPASVYDSADMSVVAGSFAAGDGLPPRKIHRRSHSDVQTGFIPIAPLVVKSEPCDDRADGIEERKSVAIVGDDLFDAFLNLESFGVVESSDYQSKGSGTSKNSAYSCESEAESCAIDCCVADQSAADTKDSRHFRSSSMDGLVGGLNFGEGQLRVPPSLGSKRSQRSERNSMDVTFSLEFGSVEFSGAELKAIMADKRLEEIALSDPKRAKRIVANRQSAARSKERKLRYISELECKVKTLQAKSTTLSAHLTLLQGDSAGIAAQNNELKIRLQSMEHQAQLRDALNEALGAEVQRLRLASAQLDDSLSKQMKQATSITS